MEFRKMVMITLYARQQKRHRCIEQSFGLCGRRWGWDDLGEWHWNMYIIICETDHQSRSNAWDRVLRADALGWPWGMGWGGRWEGGLVWRDKCTPMADSCQCMAKPTAAAAKLLQSCLTLCDPIDGLLPGSSVPGILQARTLEWVAISFSNAWKWKVKVKSLHKWRKFRSLLWGWDKPGTRQAFYGAC